MSNWPATDTEERITSTYRARNENAAQTIVEHRMQPGWKLAEGQTPVESTVNAQRFRMVLPSRQETVFEVREVRQGTATVTVGNVDPLFIARLAKTGISAAALERELKPVLDKKAELSVIERRLAALNERTVIVGDQERLRENMKALRGSSEEKQLLQRYTRQLDQPGNPARGA